MDFSRSKNRDSDEELLYATQEDKPSIANIIDERPAHLKAKDAVDDKSKWKKLGGDEESFHSAGVRTKEASDKHFQPKRSKTKRRDSNNSDLSPPRPTRRDKSNSDSDLSPPRSSNRGKTRKDDSDSDLSPPRPSQSSSSRTVESSKSRHHDKLKRVEQEEQHSRSSDQSKRMSKTLSGKTAGLSHASSLRIESEEARRREKETITKLSDDVSGRGATTIYRDRTTGRKRDLQAEEAEQHRKNSEKARREAEIKAKYAELSAGIVQNKEKKERLDEAVREMEKPLARSKDDADLDEHLKSRELEDDPMIAYVRKKKSKKGSKTASGEVIPQRPVYRGATAPPPNRFGIPPGYRWDGVDRSNGYEKKLFDKQAEKTAIREEAYRWATEDM